MENSLKDLAIKEDKNYIEGFFDIFELLRKKRVILKRLKEQLSLDERRSFEQEKVDSLLCELKKLNNDIKSKDFLFWQMVEEGKSKGIEFSLEKLFLKYGLDNYEKKILLFLFYLKLFHPKEDNCIEIELVELFDFEDFIYERIRNLKYFDENHTLIKEKILIKNSENKFRFHNDSYTITIQPAVFHLMISVLNGDCVKEIKNVRKATENPDKVGYIKKPQYTLDDVILKEDVKEKILFFLQSNNDYLESLETYKKIKKGTGLVFLFYGPPGTGKSILAEAIASYLKKDLLAVAFPKILSSWLGETDKNITKIFEIAKEKNLVICIDEAESLLYNRRFAYQEHEIRFVDVILQEIENFEGEVILTTNMEVLLDEALERRVSLKVKFEIPDKDLREKIWRVHIPDKVKIAEDVDFKFLAKEFDFSGGYIKNAVLNALRKLAKESRDTITMADLLFGANLEKEGCFTKRTKGKIGFHNT